MRAASLDFLCSAEFLRRLGFGSLQRALIAKAGQETEIVEMEGGEVQSAHKRSHP